MLKLGNQKRTVIVFAADHDDYRNWVRTFGRHLGNVEFKMAKSYKDVKGKHRSKTFLLFLENCQLHPKFSEMCPYMGRLAQNSLKRQALEQKIKNHVAHQKIREEIKVEFPEAAMV